MAGRHSHPEGRAARFVTLEQSRAFGLRQDVNRSYEELASGLDHASHDHADAVPIVSVAVALVAAVAFGFATVLQQGSARSTALRQPSLGHSWLPVVSFLHRLLRDRLWLLGWAFSNLGFLCHALALHLGTIAVIQAVLVSQLLFALLISARRHSLRLMPRDWLGAATICAGIVTIVLLRGNVSQQEPSGHAVAGYATILAVAIAILITAARVATVRDHRRQAAAVLAGRTAGPPRQTRTALLALASGMSFSGTASMIVLLTGDVSLDGPLGLLGWPTVGVIAFSITGTLLMQDAFASGSLPTAVATMTITDPICSAIVGAVLFDAVPPDGWQLLVGMPACAALVITGVVLLATSRTLHDERHLHSAPVVPVTGAVWSASSSETVGSRR